MFLHKSIYIFAIIVLHLICSEANGQVLNGNPLKNTDKNTNLHLSNREGVNRAKLNTQKLAFKLYPNPAIDYIKIEFESDTLINISVFNLIGKKLISITPTVFFTSSQEVNLAQIPSGQYILRYTLMNGEVGSRTFIKQ